MLESKAAASHSRPFVSARGRRADCSVGIRLRSRLPPQVSTSISQSAWSPSPLNFSVLTGFLRLFPNPVPRNCRNPQIQHRFGCHRSLENAATSRELGLVCLYQGGQVGRVRLVLRDGRIAMKHHTGSLTPSEFLLAKYSQFCRNKCVRG